MLEKMLSAVTSARFGPAPRRAGAPLSPETASLIHERRKAEELQRMRRQELYFTRRM